MAVITEKLADLASSAFLDTARITGAGRLSARFVTVELECASFRDAEWVPGAKLQIRPRRGTLGLRTYTPFDWDHRRGTAQVIAYTHGDGPGSAWFDHIQIGDECDFTGPRRSIDLRGPSEVLFVGDESSVGLACAQRSQASRATYVFESTDPDELRALLADLDLGGPTTIIPRTDGHEPLLEAVQAGADHTGSFDLVVTGDASAVHALRRAARGWPRRPERVTGKAYWARGRTGLD